MLLGDTESDTIMVFLSKKYKTDTKLRCLIIGFNTEILGKSRGMMSNIMFHLEDTLKVPLIVKENQSKYGILRMSSLPEHTIILSQGITLSIVSI